MTETEQLNEWLLRMENNPVGEGPKRQMAVIRSTIKQCGLDIIRNTPGGAGRNLALDQLQIVMFWANHDIATPVQEGLFE